MTTNFNKWRWDQGRLTYFQFGHLKEIAQTLVKLDGVSLDQAQDPLRQVLEKETTLPFAPANYTVWRNYKRVFECAFLATRVDDKLFVTDFCKRLASEDDGEMDVDEFLSLLAPRFRFPFPAFTGYQQTRNFVYPFCAVLKRLFSDFLEQGKASLTIEEVFSLIIGNDCTGLEPLSFYKKLKPTDRIPDGDEERQVREMLIFLSQLSILKWYNGRLIIDITSKDYEDYDGFQSIITPIVKEAKSTKEQEFISITTLTSETAYPFKLQSRELPADELFIEGKRTRVTHIKIERSPLLRKLFLAANPGTVCDMCTIDTKKRYPWTDNLLEVHHVLPLSSSLTITGEGTSLNDVIGLCPNCHKSVHAYYRGWLNGNELDDFRDRQEAKKVYLEAKANTQQ